MELRPPPPELLPPSMDPSMEVRPPKPQILNPYPQTPKSYLCSPAPKSQLADKGAVRKRIVCGPAMELRLPPPERLPPPSVGPSM